MIDKDDGLVPVAMADALRAEARGMAHAYRDVFMATAPPGAIIGIYLKGSSSRPWSSMLDYVPELSDVDLHIRVADGYLHALRTLPFAFHVANEALAAFEATFPEPYHTPRPQVFFLNDIEKQPGYIPSPMGTVETLYGDPYQGAARKDYASCAGWDLQRFSLDAPVILDGLALKVIDRPGALLWDAVFTITWRVGPAGPRLLTQLGMHPFDAWSLNRTAVVRELAKRGWAGVGRRYAEFYTAGWEGYESEFRDADAARRALTSAAKFYAEGQALVRSTQRRRGRRTG